MLIYSMILIKTHAFLYSYHIIIYIITIQYLYIQYSSTVHLKYSYTCIHHNLPRYYLRYFLITINLLLYL